MTTLTSKAKKKRREKFSPKEMTLLEHLEELRSRILKMAIAVVVATIISIAFTPTLLKILIIPYGRQLQILGPTESIGIFFRVALTSGLVLAMPVIVYQVIRFILPGLTPREQRILFIGVPAATGLFLLGAAFAWFIMIPAAVNFLSTFQLDVFEPDWRSKEYIPFVTALVFWIGVAFETPLIIFIMAKIGWVTPQMLIKGWRFAVVIIAILAALITPTVDPFNMALVMAPLLVLYGISILLTYLA